MSVFSPSGEQKVWPPHSPPRCSSPRRLLRSHRAQSLHPVRCAPLLWKCGTELNLHGSDPISQKGKVAQVTCDLPRIFHPPPPRPHSAVACACGRPPAPELLVNFLRCLQRTGGRAAGRGTEFQASTKTAAPLAASLDKRSMFWGNCFTLPGPSWTRKTHRVRAHALSPSLCVSLFLLFHRSQHPPPRPHSLPHPVCVRVCVRVSLSLQKSEVFG